jgi:SpoVK/Ycf46/Vps4 family AAA+-type ATPase
MNHVTSNDNVFIIAATNQLEMLDKACLRRFHKRLQVNLPDQKARKLILMNNLDDSELSEGDFDAVSTDLENFSGSDLEDLCREVSMRPIKELIEHRKLSGFSNLTDRQRKVNISDFQEVLKYFKASSTTYDP